MQKHASWLARLYAWACQRLYAELAPYYDLISALVSGGRWSHWRRLALDFLPADMAQPRVLELGFGPGGLLCDLAQHPVHVVGLELSAAMQWTAAHKLQQRGLRVPRVQATAGAMPFASGTFDVIIATFPTAYILESSTLNECVRLLTGSEEATVGSGRLIIVGLWVGLRPAWLGRLIPLFYGVPAPQMRQAISERFAAVSLPVTWQTVQDGPFDVSVMIAEKPKKI